MRHESTPVRHNLKITLFIFLIAIILTPTLSPRAELANANEMATVCQNWLDLNLFIKGGWAGSSNPEIASIRAIEADGVHLADYYEIVPDGFIVVPVLKELPPIMVSSTSTHLDFDEPDGMSHLIREILSDRLTRFRDYYGSLEYVADDPELTRATNTPQLWNDYLLDKKSFLMKVAADLPNRAEVGPLLTTAWHQGSPYNDLCPMGDGGRSVVGCVATAAAQILRYWRWPINGTGEVAYYWDGDQSCNDNGTPGGTLSADFSDEYVWDDTPGNLAELCYEVGVAFHMDYGACGSGSYTDMAVNVFTNYFKYKPGINKQNRSSYTADDWFELFKPEIDAGRPMQYRITSHSIVCDGYRDTGGLKQYHFNYGWGGYNNAWFTLDNLYCPWSGCGAMEEYMIRNIEPDYMTLAADEPFGLTPHAVNFNYQSELTADNWLWDFGDGQSSELESPAHTYEDPGLYDVSLTITSNGQPYQSRERQFVVVVADTMIAVDAYGDVGSSVAVPIYIHNNVALNKIVVPIKYSGTFNLTFDSVSTIDFRASDFLFNIHNIGSGYMALEFLKNGDDLPAGSGIIASVWFTINSTGTAHQTSIVLDDIGSYQRMFYSDIADYKPRAVNAVIRLPFICGDTDANYEINILDVVFLINHLYKGGASPEPLESADVNKDMVVNILDVVRLINSIYKGGAAPECP